MDERQKKSNELRDKFKFPEKVKIPKQIILLGDIYKIEQVPKTRMDNFDKEFELSYPVNACIIYPLKKIFIIKDQSERMKYFSLWHELGHYFAKYYHIEEDHEMFAEAFMQFVCKINEQIRVE